jgi:AAA15 family ATPase/GTPase
MIKSLKLANFRSIQTLPNDIELAPITLLYGGNGAGKSSLLYALLVLKNIVLNPNQPPDAFFNFLVMNLGGFEQVVFNHKKQGASMILGISMQEKETIIDYEVQISSNIGKFTLQTKDGFNSRLFLEVTFPYPANGNVTQSLSVGENKYEVSWNGLTANITIPSNVTPEAQEEAKRINILLNYPVETLRQVDYIPVRRGFFKPQYQQVPISSYLVGEDEVASLLAKDPYLPGKLSQYLQDITNREFSVHTPPGTSFSILQSCDKLARITTELVNDGFGTNQLVYLLAKILRSDTELICIEEPEINLHPTSIRYLAQSLINMVKEEGKQFLITTHSESLVLALLAQVAKKAIEPNDLACYLVKKEKKTTSFEKQNVNEKGQVEGGLKSFIEAELKDLKEFLGA